MPPVPESTDRSVGARVRRVVGTLALLGSSAGAMAVALWLLPAAGALWGGAVSLVGTLVIGSVVGNAKASERTRGPIANGGRHGLLMAYDASQMSGLAYGPIAQLGGRAIVTYSWLRSRADQRIDLADGHVLFGPFELPTGSYEMHVAYREDGVRAPWSVANFVLEMRGLLTGGEDTCRVRIDLEPAS